MSKDHEALVLQAAGVAAPGEDWWERFFPEDLPQDWQLEYYTHYHSRLLLPASVWTETKAPAFGDWTAAVPPALRLTLDWPVELAAEAGAAHARVLAGAVGDRLQAVAPGPMEPAQAQAIRAALEAAGLGRLMVYGAGEERVIARAEAACFYPAPVSRSASASGGGAWQISPEAGLDAPGWRALVEALGQAGGSGETPVFLRARPERLSDFRTIAALLGLG
ncbi:hypothetical protein [Thioalkalivibrio sp. ALMg11]|uniref:hypothetical protein n=1 Tax=Thioalkalivibrio sp. ALMg11 TaxID=1158165 RepID=UPI0003606C46|nr:hypothetical protein [Thioalkalivibrio sp. ALMg11]